MRYCILLLIALCVCCSSIGSASEPKLSAAQQEVLKVSQARRDAQNSRDLVAAERVVAEDCVFTLADGAPVTKRKRYEALDKSPAEYDHTRNSRDIVVHLYGDTAVINYRTTEHEQFGDNDIISELRTTETWIKRNGDWLLIAVQSQNIPVNFRRPVTVDQAKYADYVGVYEWRPNDRTENVFLKDGKLWSELGGDVDEYLAAGGDSFFIREGDLGMSTFKRDTTGRVIGYTYHRTDGQEIHEKKVK